MSRRPDGHGTTVVVARQGVRLLVDLGPMPSSSLASEHDVSRREELLARLPLPVTDDEARALLKLLGPDDCYGLAWTVIHAIETAPGWPLADALAADGNEWVDILRARARMGQ